MNQLIIRCIHEYDKKIFLGFLLISVDIYLVSKVVKNHEERLKNIEEKLNVEKENG